MDEPDSNFRSRTVPEDSTVHDGLNNEDVQYASLLEDLASDIQDFEAPTWSLAVDQQFVKAYSKEAVKRQDVIHELVQTEINYVRTLKVVLGVYMSEIREAQLMDDSQLERLFPHVDRLLHKHQHFLERLKGRRTESLEPGSTQNYCIQRIGDLLISQFSDENGKKLQDSYGVFCSRHNEAVNFYKDLLQNNKKFQNLMRKIGQLSIVRRLGVPEGILLITQRITKYPVLVERIIKNTEAGSEEHRDLVLALERIKETILQVNDHVHQYELLRELAAKLDPKSMGRTSNGQVFRRDELFQDGTRILHDGLLIWKSPNRSKDVLVVLLPDLLLLLQEKDQKYVFASLDGKPAVLPLQKVLVREAAQSQRVMYLISTSDSKAELYEFHTSSGEERASWRQRIWQAIENCPPVKEEQLLPESQEEVFSEKLKDSQEQLYVTDALMEQLLERKLRHFAELAKKVTETPAPPRRLLLTGAASDLQQGEKLLRDAIVEAEQFQALLVDSERQPLAPAVERVNAGLIPKRAETIGGCDRTPSDILKSLILQDGYRNRNQRPNSDPQLRERYLDSLELSADEEITPAWLSPHSPHFLQTQVSSTATRLIQKLYSLQVLVAQQDSEIGLLRAATAERERLWRQRGNLLLEQEKLRQLEKQREDLVQQQQLLTQMKQEQVAWEQQRQVYERERQAEDEELRRRQEECGRKEAKLAAEQVALYSNQEEYQRNLEHLREAAQTVEKEREKLKQEQERQNKYKKYKTISNMRNSSALESVQALPSSPTDDLKLSPKPHSRPSLSQANTSFLERPPLVPPRKESIAVKSEVPIQLVSTTNQAMKAGSVQQQIPTKLAHTKKGGKSKNTHHRNNSAGLYTKTSPLYSASIEVSDVVPIKVSGKEGGSLKARNSSSSRHLSPDLYIPPDEVWKTPRSGTSMRNPSHGSSPSQPAHRKENVKEHEDILYF